MIKKSWFQCALKIFFESNFDVSELTEAIGIQPYVAKRFSESGYTKAWNTKQPGRWEYYDPARYLKSMSLEQILADFLRPFSEEKVKIINETAQRYHGKVVLVINIYFYHKCLPDMVFGENNMQVIHGLNANIEININEDT